MSDMTTWDKWREASMIAIVFGFAVALVGVGVAMFFAYKSPPPPRMVCTCEANP